MNGHATLAPSAAERWIVCPASVRMAASVPEEPSSSYAQEGTNAHELAEAMARYQLLGGPEVDVDAWRARLGEDYDEMQQHAQGYVDYLCGLLASYPDAQLLLEQRLPTGLPECWGTSDAVIVSPTVVETVDFKYGQGVRVEAAENPQLRLYGVGALEAFGDLLGEVDTVRLTVYQPRLDHVAGEVLTADELRAWRDGLLPVAQAALGPDAPFGPSEAACRWCPVSGSCKAQMEWATVRDFGERPDTLSDEELASALDAIPFIRQWASAVEDYALDRAYSKGRPIPGYKVVLSGGRRSVVNPKGLIEAAHQAGYKTKDVADLKTKGIGALEKKLGDDFATVAAPFIVKSTGKPALVDESDKRPATAPEVGAAEDFA